MAEHVYLCTTLLYSNTCAYRKNNIYTVNFNCNEIELKIQKGDSKTVFSFCTASITYVKQKYSPAPSPVLDASHA